jgi:RND family efflux transporter MFP subunit
MSAVGEVMNQDQQVVVPELPSTGTDQPSSTPATPPSAPDHPAAPSPRPHWRPDPKKKIEVVAIVILAACAALLVLYIWDLPPFAGGVEVTDDAYVRAHTTVIAPQVSGYVIDVSVDDYRHVRAGEILARIDDVIYRARVDQAQANLDAAIAALASVRAQLTKAQADMGRIGALAKQGAASQQQRDQTVAALRQAEAAAGTDGKTPGSAVAQIEEARAQLRLAQIDLDHTVIRAPAAGQLGEVGVRLGQYVTNGTELMELVPSSRWVIAQYKESQTSHMRVGQPASFTVDGLSDARFTGRVEHISPASGQEFAVLKPDNATGNFVKVPQRIGVWISIDPAQKLEDRLRAGMSVEAHIDTSHD